MKLAIDICGKNIILGGSCDKGLTSQPLYLIYRCKNIMTKHERKAIVLTIW